MAGSIADSDKPLRYACDRCHSQKLRCPRSNDQDGGNPDEPCSRCRKAGVACVVSLRGKVGRPSKVSKKKASTPRTSRSYLTPEMDIPPCDPAMVVNGNENDLVPSWASEDRLVDMLDFDQATPPSTVNRRGFKEPSTDSDSRETSTDVSSVGGTFSDHFSTSGIVTPMDPFLMDFDAGLEFPTFYIPTDVPDILDASQDSSNPTASMCDLMQEETLSSLITPPQFPSPPTQKQRTGGDMANNTTPANFSSTACYHKLSDLNSRILSSSARTKPSSNSSEILKEVVGFSGELIDTARSSMPYFVGSRRSSNTASEKDRDMAGDGDGEPHARHRRRQSSKSSEWSSFGSPSAECSVPESAVIFLLLGCYTQILHLFEVTTNSLWDLHSAASVSAEDSAGTAGSLLEASLAIHTVTYLLSRLHRAFAVDEAEPASATSANGEANAWKRSFVGGKGLEDGLLGRAFGEIREREQWLMQRTQLLQRKINNCNM